MHRSTPAAGHVSLPPVFFVYSSVMRMWETRYVFDEPRTDMTMFQKFGFTLIATAVLGACTPAACETEPVKVETPQGTVTCQLYTSALTDWDRSIDHPATMTVAVADNYCKTKAQAK